MKKLFVLFISAALFSCSGSDDSPVIDDDSNNGFSTFKIEFSKSGNVDEWFEELDLLPIEPSPLPFFVACWGTTSRLGKAYK